MKQNALEIVRYFTAIFGAAMIFSIFMSIQGFKCATVCQENIDILVADITWKSIAALLLFIATVGIGQYLHQTDLNEEQ